MNLSDDDFTLYGLPHRQLLDRGALDAQWRALQAQVHPDRFASEGVAAQRVAMQWAVRVNEAHQRLKDPLSRAGYLCELRGVAIDAERNTAMPAEFLVQQLQWREALDDAIDESAVQLLQSQVAEEEAAMFAEVARLLDEADDAAAAAGTVRALMFIARFRRDIDQRLDRLDALSSY